MSRFWKRALSHLANNQSRSIPNGGSRSGVRVTETRDGTVYQLGGNFSGHGVANESATQKTESTGRSDLYRELEQQKRARRGE